MRLHSDYFGISPSVWAWPSCQLKLYVSGSCAVGERGFKWYQEACVWVTPLRIVPSCVQTDELGLERFLSLE